jgi:hypothetical protein
MERRKLGINDSRADQSPQHKGTEGLQRFRLTLAIVERRLHTPTEEIAQPVATVDAGGFHFRFKPDRRRAVPPGSPYRERRAHPD